MFVACLRFSLCFYDALVFVVLLPLMFVGGCVLFCLVVVFVSCVSLVIVVCLFICVSRSLLFVLFVHLCCCGLLFVVCRCLLVCSVWCNMFR